MLVLLLAIKMLMLSLMVLLVLRRRQRLRAMGARHTDGDKRRLALTQSVQQRRTVRGEVQTQVLPGVGLCGCVGRGGGKRGRIMMD